MSKWLPLLYLIVASVGIGVAGDGDIPTWAVLMYSIPLGALGSWLYQLREDVDRQRDEAERWP